MKSSFAEHLLQSNHSYTNIDTNMKILALEKKGEVMDCKDGLHIFLNKLADPNILNVTHGTNKNPIFEYVYNMKKPK